MKPFLSSHFPTAIPLFLLLLLSPVFSTCSSELHSLLSLKSSLTDPLDSLHDWTSTTTANNDDVDYDGVQLHHHPTITPQPPPYCSWSGIQCDPDTHQITTLDLSSRNLSGTIPSSIQHLTQLTHLNLSHNAFSGPFPSVIFSLTSLQTLDINHNNFNSTFPPNGFSNLKSLNYLDCYSNSFTGLLPIDLSGHETLQHLNLGGSYFEGPIPSGYGNLPNLNFLYLAGNTINGSIPSQLGNMTQLERIEIGYNSDLTGSIPAELGQLSKLTYLDISCSDLSGSIPSEFGNLTRLQTLLLFRNRLSGSIPSSISGMKSLSILDLSNNLLTGSIPQSITSLNQITLISLMNNRLTGSIPSAIGSLPNLTILHLWNNSLTGPLPPNLGTNAKLEKLDVSSNNLTGQVPSHLCRNNRLYKLLLFSNQFTSTLPVSVAHCTSLTRVRIQLNNFYGPIPIGFGNLPNLTYLDLSSNNFSGPIPNDLSNSVSLGTLNLSSNNFQTPLPLNIWKIPNLQIFSASNAQLTGAIPNFSGCGNLYKFELSHNELSGAIPWDIGDCVKLNSMDLSGNLLSGIIPWEISALTSITYVDLSSNGLSGSIPSGLDNCSTLENFNVSFNRLVGSIPDSGPIFAHLHPSSFYGNDGLCGKLMGKRCEGDDEDGSSSSVDDGKRNAGAAVVWITAVAFGVGLFVLLAGIRCFQNEIGGGGSSSGWRLGVGGDQQQVKSWKLTAFQRLSFTAEDVLECLAMSDKVIGMGATGTVYRAEMPGGEVIAVKKLWGRQKESMTTNGWRSSSGGGEDGEVLAEVDVLGNVRHRNIVRLLGCCSNKETTMLLYEYMPNGSLDDLLHGRNKGEHHLADWLIRYKIALGVAQGICYLHHDCDPLIVHRDLKPSNILLDEEMEARVADFGVAKLIMAQGCKESMSVVAGSYGYIAPEYAYTLQVDEKSDIYSYGVVLLEILTGKRSVDPEFGDGLSIVDWVRMKIKTKDGDGVGSILDDKAGAACVSVKEEMTLVLKVALICTSKNPADRPSMRDVVSMLQEARPQRKLVGVVDDERCDHHVIRINNGCSSSSNSMGDCSSSLEGKESSVTC